MTKWLPVVGYEELYEVSNTGRVRSVRKELKLDEANVGYLRVCLSKGGKTRKHSVHRLVAEAFIPAVDGKNCVNHIDSDRKNNHVSNLEWCTHRENTLHAMRTGRLTHPKGWKFPPEKLKTHCKWGHPRTPDNVYKSGACRLCSLRYSHEQQVRLRQAQRNKLRKEK